VRYRIESNDELGSRIAKDKLPGRGANAYINAWNKNQNPQKAKCL
jgi:hypothetical protein